MSKIQVYSVDKNDCTQYKIAPPPPREMPYILDIYPVVVLLWINLVS